MTVKKAVPAKKAAPAKTRETFSAEERAAMKERAQELKRGTDRADGEADLLAKIAEMGDADRRLAERVHAIVMATAPDLSPKTWYGFPAYAKDGVLICHFQPASKFKTRYATLGFSDKAQLDDGVMWPTSYALTQLTPEAEATIEALVKKAVG